MCAHVHRIAIPRLARDDGRLGSVANADLDVAREHTGSTVLEDHRALAERRELDHEVRRGRRTAARDHDVRATDGLCAEREDRDVGRLR